MNDQVKVELRRCNSYAIVIDNGVGNKENPDMLTQEELERLVKEAFELVNNHYQMQADYSPRVPNAIFIDDRYADEVED